MKKKKRKKAHLTHSLHNMYNLPCTRIHFLASFHKYDTDVSIINTYLHETGEQVNGKCFAHDFCAVRNSTCILACRRRTRKLTQPLAERTSGRENESYVYNSIFQVCCTYFSQQIFQYALLLLLIFFFIISSCMPVVSIAST